MDIKSLWNKFLELRKSPACIIFSIMGLFDIIAFIFFISVITYIDAALFLYILSMCYLSIRIPAFIYYMTIIIGLFIIEKIFKIELKNNFVENNKIYKNLWLIGFISAIIGCLSLPLINNFLNKYGPLL